MTPIAGSAPLPSQEQKNADTSAVRDSIRSPVIPAIGEFEILQDTTALQRTRFLWTDARYVGDLLGYVSGLLTQEQGEPGQPGQLTIGGVGLPGISFLMDGTPIGDPVTGMLNLFDVPIEFIERIELIRGPRSFLYGGNGTGGTVNFVTRQYDTNRPLTKIRFLQGPYEHLMTDGLFTQNVARGVNVTIGFLRQVTDGRYSNSNLDFWGIRSRIRYNVSDRLNIVVSDFYARSLNGVNGGVLVDSTLRGGLDVFQGTQAIVQSTRSNMTRTRRDISLQTIAKPFPDSTMTTHFRLYHSREERSFSDPEQRYPDLFKEFSWNIAGMRAQQQIRVGTGSFLFGVDAERRTVSPSRFFAETSKNYYAWYGKGEFSFLDLMSVAFFGRGEKLKGAQALSYGFDTHVFVTPTIILRGGYSNSFRLPTFLESNWPAYFFGFNGINLLERHRLTEIGVSLALPRDITVSATGFSRKVENALVHRTLSGATVPTAIESVPEVTMKGLHGLAGMGIWKFSVTGTLTFTEIRNQSVLTPILPRFIITGELAYRDQLFEGALDTRIAARSRYMSRHQGTIFLPSLFVQTENNGKTLNAFSTIDLSGVFLIGDAYITITWENILDERYFTAPFYPMLDRNVKIGVNWIFLD